MKQLFELSFPKEVRIIIPILDDWECAFILCRMLDQTFDSFPEYFVSVMFVDDGSRIRPKLAEFEVTTLKEVEILCLLGNVGHQRAIAIGICYVQFNRPCDIVVVMDGDGEDRPEDVPKLLKALEDDDNNFAVFAKRQKRLESVSFRAGYFMYEVLHRILTGLPIRFGNFSALRFSVLPRLTLMPELWVHYAATALHSRIPFNALPLNRGKRLRGDSKMRLEKLVDHGFSAISIYPTLNVRILVGSFAICLLLISVAVISIVIRFTTNLAIPGWTTTVLGLSATLLCLATFTSLLFIFLNLKIRNSAVAMPFQVYQAYIEKCETTQNVTSLHR
jgi:glycosyltransferase involved in cell wall biosynthesis